MNWFSPWMIVLYVVVAALAILAIRDRKAGGTGIIRNFPIVGHVRYWLIEIGPELRQYLVAHNREEKPFNRSEREWIERSAIGANNYFGFGTDDQLLGTGYPIIKQSQFPYGELSFADKGKSLTSHAIACTKTIGEWHKRPNPFRPMSMVNISAMSFGSLSGRAVESLNRGAKLAGLYQNTGEGGVSRYHRTGADVMYQIGTGMFGCRDAEGRFSPDHLHKLVADVPQIRAIEIKLSQGAKPGKGGVLPGKKVTAEIAEARGVNIGQDCISPNKHAEFSSITEMIDFIENVARITQRPVGIKSAIGQIEFWHELAEKMTADPTRGPDFITIDGGEGGTGAAPMTFADHVSLPFKTAFPRVYKIFHDKGIAQHIVWIGSGKLGFPDRAVTAFAIGCDLIHIAREAMLSIGCIQAQKCHTNHCPAGVATQSQYLQKAINVDEASHRLARYVDSFRKELLDVAHACGYAHPSQIKATDIELCSGPNSFTPLAHYIGYEPVKPTWVVKEHAEPEIVREQPNKGHARTLRLDKSRLMAEMAKAGAEGK